MGEEIGSYLQQLRANQRLTTTRLAQKAGIRRATLSEWQTGKRQPRLAELEAVLNALGASDTQRQKARERLRTPTNVLSLREEIAVQNRELVEMAGTAPHGGDLIRAMRLRKGWTQARLAEQMGVTQAAVAGWERSDRWPDTETLHTLCYLLEAQEEELTALALGRFSLAEGQPPLTVEDIRAQLLDIFDSRFSWADYALTELRLLTLLAQAWSLARQSDAGRSVLAEVFVAYADHLFLQRRFGECRRPASHAMDLYSSLHRKDSHSDRAAIRLAEANARCGSRQGLDSAISLLQQWLPTTSNPCFTGWIMSGLAQCYAADGRMEEALRLGWESVRVAAHVPDYDDYLHRHYDLVRILLQADRVAEAQDIALAHDHHSYYLLVQAEVSLRAGAQATAYHHAERIRTFFETPYNITQPEMRFYRSLVDTLAERLEGADTSCIGER